MTTGRRARGSQVSVLWMWLWFGLLTGLAELGVLTYRELLFDPTTWVSPQVVWMAPTANVLALAAPALVLYVLTRWRRDRSWIEVAAGTFAFVGFVALLLMYPLHRIALLILAGGLAVQTARLVSRHKEGFARLVRGTVLWLVALVVLMGVGLNGTRWIGERLTLASLPSASPQAPNVLVIILDTVRAMSLSLYGHDRPTTPELERLAERGVVFDWAITPSPWTLPAHASVFTGRYPHETSADWKVPLDDAHPTLAEVLREHGYVTAGFVANLAYASYEHGLDRGFIRYDDYPLSVGQLALSASLGRSLTNNPRVRWAIGKIDILNRKSAERIGSDFLAWLARNGDRPFLVFLNYYDAHEPYLPPRPFDALFEPRDSERGFSYYVNEAWRTDKWELSANGIAVERAAYEGAIAYLDQQLGLLLNELDRAGQLENTLVVITSDHGEHFGEHDLVDHGNSLYLPLLHVPLVMAGPGVTAGTRVGVPVTLRDVPATILDLLELRAVPPFPGRSLTRYFGGAEGGEPASADTLLAEVTGGFGNQKEPISRGDLRALVAGGFHYIRNGDGKEELYDLYRDRTSQENLADSLVNVVENFRRYLELKVGDPQLAGVVETAAGRHTP